MSDASLSASDFPQSSMIDAPSNDSDDIDSLPSEADSDDITISEEESESDAEREWRESLQQLEMLLSWKSFMEWKYPVSITITNKARFNTMGAIEAAASL